MATGKGERLVFRHRRKDVGRLLKERGEDYKRGTEGFKARAGLEQWWERKRAAAAAAAAAAFLKKKREKKKKEGKVVRDQADAG